MLFNKYWSLKLDTTESDFYYSSTTSSYEKVPYVYDMF